MPEFIFEIIENHFWNDVDFEIPDFSLGSDEEVEPIFEDVFVTENIETL